MHSFRSRRCTKNHFCTHLPTTWSLMHEVGLSRLALHWPRTVEAADMYHLHSKTEGEILMNVTLCFRDVMAALVILDFPFCPDNFGNCFVFVQFRRQGPQTNRNHPGRHQSKPIWERYYWGQNDYMPKKLFWAINFWIASHYRTSIFVCPINFRL